MKIYQFKHNKVVYFQLTGDDVQAWDVNTSTKMLHVRCYNADAQEIWEDYYEPIRFYKVAKEVTNPKIKKMIELVFL